MSRTRRHSRAQITSGYCRAISQLRSRDPPNADLASISARKSSPDFTLSESAGASCTDSPYALLVGSVAKRTEMEIAFTFSPGAVGAEAALGLRRIDYCGCESHDQSGRAKVP